MPENKIMLEYNHLLQNRYRILRKIGEGAFGSVFLADDTWRKRQVAIKYFCPEDRHITPALFTENFIFLQLLTHPNLIEVYDFRYDQCFFTVQEYFDGKNLNYFKLKGNQFDDIYDFVIQICYALDYLHSRNIIHRDLKPENILYRYQDGRIQAKLTDFGLAVNKNETVSLAGTISFLAPELRQGAKANEQSDLYALGLILYQLVTGVTPFPVDQSDEKLLQLQLNFFPELPRNVNSNIPVALENIILNLIEPDPQNRFASAVEVIRAINQKTGRSYPLEVGNTRSFLSTSQFTTQRSAYNHMMQLYNKSKENQGRIGLISGEIGIGKNRVITELRQAIQLDFHRVFVFDAQKHAVPFSKWMQNILMGCGKLENAIDVKKVYSLLETLKDRFFENEHRRKQLIHLLIDIARQLQPLTFFITNVEFVEDAISLFLHELAAQLENVPLFVGISCIHADTFLDIAHKEIIRLYPLNKEETRHFVNRILLQPMPKDFTAVIYQETSGNPYFIKEILAMFIRDNLLFRHEHEWHLREQWKDFQFPQSLEEVIQFRIDSLPEDVRRYVARLALVEESFNFYLVRYLIPELQEELIAAVAKVTQVNIFTESTTGSNYIYSFTQPQIRKFLRMYLSSDEELQYACKIAKFYQGNLSENSKSADYQRVYVYFLKGQNYVQSLKYALLTAQHYRLEMHNKEAYEYYQKAFGLLKQTPQDCEGNKLFWKELPDFLQTILIMGHFNAGIDMCHELSEYDSENFEIYKFLGYYLYRTGQTQQAFAAYDQALAYAKKEDDRAGVDIEKAFTYVLQGDYRSAREICQKYPKVQGMPAARKWNCLGAIAFFTGKTKLAKESFNKALAIYNRLKDTYNVASVYNNMAITYKHECNYQQSLQHFINGLHIAEQLDSDNLIAIQNNNLGEVYLVLGNLPKAMDHFQRSLKICRDTHSLNLMLDGSINLAETYLLQNEFSKMTTCLLESYRIAHEIQASVIDRSRMILLIAKANILRGRYRKALHKLEAVYENIKDSDIPDILFQVLELQVKIFHQLGDSQRLQAKLEELEQIEMNDQRMAKYLYLRSLDCEIRQEYEEAAELLNHAIKEVHKLDARVDLLELKLQYVDTLLHQNRLDLAARNLQIVFNNIRQYGVRVFSTSANLLEIRLQIKQGQGKRRSVLRRLYETITEAKRQKFFPLLIEAYDLMAYLYRLHQNDMLAQSTQKLRYQIHRKMELFLPDFSGMHFLAEDHVQERHFPQVESCTWQRHVQEEFIQQLEKLLVIGDYDILRREIVRFVQQELEVFRVGLFIHENDHSPLTLVKAYNMEPQSFSRYEYAERLALIEKTFQQGAFIRKKMQNVDILMAPLPGEKGNIGLLYVENHAEGDFEENEIKLFQKIATFGGIGLGHALNLRNLKAKNYNLENILELSKNLAGLLDMDELLHEFLKIALKTTRCESALLFMYGEDKKMHLRMTMDRNGRKIPAGRLQFSYSILQKVIEERTTIRLTNALESSEFQMAKSVHTLRLHSVLSAPIQSKTDLIGLIYLDDSQRNGRFTEFDENLISVLSAQLSVAIENAKSYGELEQANRSLQQINKLKTDFINIASHEIRTPLVPIKGYIDIMHESGMAKLSPLLEKALPPLRRNVNKILRLANAISDVARITSKEMTIEWEHLNVKVIFQQSVMQIQTALAERDLRFRTEINVENMDINGDFKLLTKAFTNILSNAIRFTPDGGEIVFGVRRPMFLEEKLSNRESVVFYVQDNGIGIEENDLEQIFEMFYEGKELHEHSSGNYEFMSAGLGIGLPVAQGIVEKHGGKIVVSSKKQRGSKFFIILPVAEN